MLAIVRLQNISFSAFCAGYSYRSALLCETQASGLLSLSSASASRWRDGNTPDHRNLVPIINDPLHMIEQKLAGQDRNSARH
jgi:hypothetical protein